MILRFGAFEIDVNAELLLKKGRTVRLQPKPFRLLYLLASQAGKLVTREEIRASLWEGDTFVDFDQGVNFAIKQVREALGEDAEHPVYIQTVPKRGYRFLAPVTVVTPGSDGLPRRGGTDLNLHKILWTNIAELRLAETRRRALRKTLLLLLLVSGTLAIGALILVRWFR